tara:strand:- start:244 stop:933 length:690 start_codon:yes stop_codon:yes gene_type:complete
MYKKSIAKNHLSQSAKEGRYGDNILVHMNKNEAAVLAKASGMDKLPINPKTGLPEAWVFTAALAATAIYGAWKGGKEQSQQSSTQSKLINQQQQQLDEALGSLEGVKGSKDEVAKQEYGQSLGDLSMQTGQSKEDLQQQYQGMLQKSGMATSGGATGKMSQMYKRIQNKFSSGSASLLGNLGKSMASVEEWYEGEKSRLGSEQKRLGFQKDLADKQKDSWYLGKHITGG